MPPPLPTIVRRVDHVGIAVSSLDTSLRFWTEALGAKVVRTTTLGGRFLGEVTGARGATARVAILDMGGRTVELLEYRSPPSRRGPPSAPFHPGAMHLALEVEDLDAVLDRIAPFGWTPQGEPQTIADGPRAGTRVIYVLGPDGEALELLQPASAAAPQPASPA